MILRGFTFFPYCHIGGGLWKIFNESDKHRGSPSHFDSSHTHSPHSHALQELKDDLLDDTAWPVVMQWFNEDH